LLKEIEDGGAGGIQADIRDIQIRFGKKRSRGDKEDRGREIARDVERLGLQSRLAVFGGEAVDRNGAAALFNVRAELFEGEFGVVAGRRRFIELDN
jgi:hypothetical protein